MGGFGASKAPPTLTPVEALNLHLIALRGLTLIQLAEFRGVSIHTINKQIASAKAHMGYKRQPLSFVILEAARLGLIPAVGARLPGSDSGQKTDVGGVKQDR